MPRRAAPEQRAAVSPAQPSRSVEPSRSPRSGPEPLEPGVLRERAARLGHRPPVSVNRPADRSLQRMIFYDIANRPYDPEVLGLAALQLKLQPFQAEWMKAPAQRALGMTEEKLKERIGQLQLQIEQTTKNDGKPLRAALEEGFLVNHIIIGDQLKGLTLKASIDKSFARRHKLNTVLHLTGAEWHDLPALGMQALKAANYPLGKMVLFEMPIGVATQYRDPGADLAGALGNFGIYRKVKVTLGAVWSQITGTGKVTHLEDISPWAPAVSYQYTTAAGNYLVKVYGDGESKIAL